MNGAGVTVEPLKVEKTPAPKKNDLVAHRKCTWRVMNRRKNQVGFFSFVVELLFENCFRGHLE